MGSIYRLLASLALTGLLAACGGSDGTPPASAPAAVAITAQPADQTVVAGTQATFTVAATAATAFQWQRSTDGGTRYVDVPGATAASYTVAAASDADGGSRFRVVVTGSGSSATSSAATLTVVAAVIAPAIVVQPAPQTVIAGQPASFSVTATGTNLAYQWQGSLDGITFENIGGERNATLAIAAVSSGASGLRFRAVVSNSAGSVASTAALLTVNAAPAAPVFTTQPASATVVAPAGATFTAAASGVPAPTLQWQRSTDGGGSFTDIAGETGGSFVVFDTVAGDPVRIYRVVASNASGTTTSAVATLTVNEATVAPTITTQPVSVSTVAGQSTQFTVAASGTPTPTYQWQVSTDGGATWGNINGATSTTFDVLNPAQANNGRQFRAVASNAAGSATSNAAVLTVTPAVVDGWQGPADPLHTDGSAQIATALAANGAGEAMAVWSQDGGIFARRYASSAWQARVQLSITDPGLGFFMPHVAINAAGRAVALWRETDGVSLNRTRAALFTPDQGWGTPTTLSSNDSSSGALPQVAIDGDGNALAVWVERETSAAAWKLVGSRFVVASGTWTLQRLDTDVIGAPTDTPRVAMNASGAAMVLWPAPSATVGSEALWVRRMAATGAWDAAEQLDAQASSAPQQRIALDTNGNAMAVWKTYDNPSFPSIWARRFDAGTAVWGSAVAVESDNTNRATSPQVAFDGSGQAVAAWVQFDGTQELVLSSRHTTAGGWSAPQQVAAGTINRMNDPSLAVNASGTAVVAWRQNNFAAASVQSAGGTWRAAQQASATGSDGVSFSLTGPAVAGIDDNGVATVVWPADNGGTRRAYAGRYR